MIDKNSYGEICKTTEAEKMARQERFITSLDFQFLTNTLELDLSNIFGKGMYPNKRDIHTFITDDMKVTAGMLRGVQHHPRFPKVHIMFEKEGDMVEVGERMKNGLMMRAKNLKIFGYRCDRPMVTIVLNGQDMSIGADEITRVMERYGKVVTCERGKNSDLSTADKFVTDGTWTVRMSPKISKKPPETIYYIRVTGEVQTWILSFDGVGSSCVLCGLQGHMGFRCNSIIPRGGKMGRQPAGLGKWTDVVHELHPPPPPPPLPGVVQPAVAGPLGQGQPQHVVAVSGPPVVPATPAATSFNDRNATFGKALLNAGTQAGVAAGDGGQSASQPAAEAARLFRNLKNSASQGHTRDLENLVNTAGWGKEVNVRVASTAAQNVRKKDSLGARPKDKLEWETVGRKNKGKGIGRKASAVSEAKLGFDDNRFGGLGGDLPSDDDDYKTDDDNEEKTDDGQAKKPSKKNVSAVRTLCATRSAYGSRRSVPLKDLMRVGKEQANNKRHGSTVEAKEKKKTKKNNYKPRKEEQQLDPDGVTPQVEVEQDQQLVNTVPGQNAAAASEITMDDNTTNGEDEPLVEPAVAKDDTADQDDPKELPENSKQMEVEKNGGSGGDDHGEVVDIQASSQLPAKNVANHPLDNHEDLEMKEKAAKVKAALDAQKKLKEDEISQQL